MCFTVPGKIISKQKDKAVVDFGIEKKEVDCSLVKVKKGDYIIEQNGLAIRKVDKKEAKETLEFLNSARQVPHLTG
ncbi:MAG: HypC/HybG/HupF family hydrogenase formation chaperone [Parcubacteria group bacterium CG_4_10_14_0_8_um_filter_35_7]|nr:MAG: HypC/HybG/HupF family hydrogenase formation chaperone [Parcubacteria group bacterium CG23_combo_of_CG06-09_8_20_14_all_35_9]PIY78495.1 MAG: HypC/HybG/HupF family hydrogenase formation chaperone [Parcubacteria group bacterium CG_4_10_14_0_8_um_filter_35_7]